MIKVLICYEVLQSGRASGGHCFATVEELSAVALNDAAKAIEQSLRERGIKYEGNVVFRSVLPIVG